MNPHTGNRDRSKRSLMGVRNHKRVKIHKAIQERNRTRNRQQFQSSDI